MAGDKDLTLDLMAVTSAVVQKKGVKHFDNSARERWRVR